MIEIILFDSLFIYFEALAVLSDEKTRYYFSLLRDNEAVFDLRSSAPSDGHSLNCCGSENKEPDSGSENGRQRALLSKMVVFAKCQKFWVMQNFNQNVYLKPNWF